MTRIIAKKKTSMKVRRTLGSQSGNTLSETDLNSFAKKFNWKGNPVKVQRALRNEG